MGNILLVGCGGFLGACCRYLLSLGMNRWGFHGFPAATLLSNLLGAFLMGFLTALFGFWFPQKKGLSLFLTTGVLGGFTTFSTFGLETVQLFQNGRWGLGIGYLALSVGGCLAGIVLGRMLAGFFQAQIR